MIDEKSLEAQKASRRIKNNNLADPNTTEKVKKDYALVREEHNRLISRITAPNQTTPSNWTLSIEEISFLEYMHGKKVSNPYIAIYWYIEYEIYDYQEKIQKFFDAGFLKSGKTFEVLDEMKAEELKKILADNSLPKSGRKDLLVKRIKENLSRENINNNYPQFQSFSLTEEGERTVSEKQMLICFRKNNRTVSPYLNVETLKKFSSRNSHLSKAECNECLKKMSWLLENAHKIERNLL